MTSFDPSVGNKRAGKKSAAPFVTGPEKTPGQGSERTTAQRVLLSNLRHDLRTPINAIIGYSEMLIEDLTEDVQAEEARSASGLCSDIEKIHQAGNELLELVNENLHQAKIEAGQLDIALEDFGARLRHNLLTPINAIIGYSEMLLEDAPALGFEAIIPDVQKIHVAAERFLALINDVVNYARILSGEVAPEAPTGDTSTMIEEVATTIQILEQKASYGRPVHGGILLVVDDDPINRDVLSRRLERQGHIVSIAENGRRALEMLDEFKFDLVLLDIMMPEMNGFQVLERLKSDSSLRDIPVIMISALDEIDSVVRCIEMGAEDHLPKPFNPVLLKARIDASLEKKWLRDKEIEYLQQVSQVTAAAADVEAERFEPESLDSVATRDDELGQMARVFQRMAREVYEREQRLKAQVQELRIQIDQVMKEREVAEITEARYFQELQHLGSETVSRIVAIHSFRGGTGKSNATANLAVLLAADGLRVGVVDTDIQSPGLHVLFGLEQAKLLHSLNDYLWGKCPIRETAHNVTPRLGPAIHGAIYLIPSSLNAGEIARVLDEGYDVGLLKDGCEELIRDLRLDILLIDTHPGLNQETLMALAISDVLAIIMRPDQQDYQGTAVTVEVARKLDVPHMMLVVNKVPERLNTAEVREMVEKTYECEVAATVPHADEMMLLASGGIFVLRYPDHPVTQGLRQAASRLMALSRL
jgi:MinD-like ATPase involved in chromosome partitioning or flagellar assembly/DNA-binding response OmpR family regulator